jgi:hypothetical protein
MNAKITLIWYQLRLQTILTQLNMCIDSSDVNELESMEAAYINNRSPEDDDIVSQLKP